VTKQFAFQQSRGNGRAVHPHIGTVAAGAQIVDGACDQLFAGACLAMKKDGGIRRRNNGNMLQYFSEGWARADDIFKALLRADFWVEIKLTIFDPAHAGKTGCSEVSEVCESNGRAHSLLLMIAVCFLGIGCQAVRFCANGNSSTRPRCCGCTHFTAFRKRTGT
jgi:hypothetical protein